MAMTTFALPEDQRIYALGLALIVLILVVLLVGAIAFFRPENLQRKVQDLKGILDSKGLADVIEETVKDRFPQLEQRERE